MVYIYGILLFVLTVALFYGVTVLIKEIILRISKKRKYGYYNSVPDNNNAVNNNNNYYNDNSTQAILKAKEKMRKK